MTHDDAHHHGSDMKAAFMGLIFGAIVLFAILTTVVKLTNAHYSSSEPAAAAAK